MVYIIQELQTNNDQTDLLPAVTKTNYNEAVSVFHTKAASAAISSVEVHTIMLHDERGDILEKLTFSHDTVAEDTEE